MFKNNIMNNIKNIDFKKINIKIIKTKLIKKDIGITDNISLKLFLFFSPINLLIEIGKPNWDKAISKLKVGIIKLYIPIPSGPNFLDIIILINIPITLVIRPPISKIIVDLINLLIPITN